MNYKRALRELMEMSGFTQAGLARVSGACNQSYIWRVLQPSVRMNGETVRRGVTIDVFMRLVQAMNGRVYIEWTDKRDYKRKKRWLIDNSDYWGDMRDEEFLVPDDEG